MALLEVENLSVRFGGVSALDDVSLGVHRGEIFGLIGPNGAGKTTLFNCLSGTLRPDKGRIAFEGDEIGRLRPYRRAQLGIARTFQNLQLFRGMTVLENLMLPVDARARRGMFADALRLPVARFEEGRAVEHARAILHLLRLADVADSPAGDLPVGVQRRVELGRALALRPKLLLLDEPGAGLDTKETAELARRLLEVRERFEITMLLVDHDMALVMRVCDYIHVLDFGRLISSGSPDHVREDPQVVRAYLGEEVA
ncbi:MAG: ABC transporter ATP-binding protein [Actinobacteria bacterium]|nr:MAG: ABC transporter ATP-binding protein [Actinomycetota bacterium]